MPQPQIDMVMTYVDGADPAHQARRQAARQALMGKIDVPAERAIWFHGVGEITYSVRSVLKAMPWIRTIHIVTDGQQPPVDASLMASGRVRIVDHRDIVPEAYRPVFASTIIESFLHRIPGLTDIWLYNNDDFFNLGAIAPDQFCEPAEDGGLRLVLRTVPAWIRLAIRLASDLSPNFLPRANAYSSGIANSARLLRSDAGFLWRNIVFPCHLTQVYRSETARRLEKVFAEQLHTARQRHFRGPDQLSWSTLAYSAECHWGGARQRRYRLFAGSGDRDELFVDFNRIHGEKKLARTWQIVRATPAAFMCLNGIPQSEAAVFASTMTERGFGLSDQDVRALP